MRSTTEALTGSLEEPLQPAEPTSESAEKAAISRVLHNACFYLTVNWWSYELCPGQHVRQFHVTEGQHLEQITTLGELPLALCMRGQVAV